MANEILESLPRGTISQQAGNWMQRNEWQRLWDIEFERGARDRIDHYTSWEPHSRIAHRETAMAFVNSAAQVFANMLLYGNVNGKIPRK